MSQALSIIKKQQAIAKALKLLMLQQPQPQPSLNVTPDPVAQRAYLVKLGLG